MSAMEAVAVVEEVLSELLTMICCPSDPQSDTVETELHQQPLLDLNTMAREQCELFNPHSLRSTATTKVEVCQIKCLNQKGSGTVKHALMKKLNNIVTRLFFI